MKPALCLFLALVIVTPVPAAASSSVETYFEESGRLLGQVFAPRATKVTRIHSHGEISSKESRVLSRECGAFGRYQFFMAGGRIYILQVWKGKEKINRSMGLVKGANTRTFELLSPAYAKDADTIYAITRTKNEEGACQYGVEPLEGADVATFRVHGGSQKFMAADKNSRYWYAAQR